MEEFWKYADSPGKFTTVFTNSSINTGFLLRWSWGKQEFIPSDIINFFDVKIKGSYLLTQELIFKTYGIKDLYLSLMKTDVDFLRKYRYTLSGDSLSLAFYLGALSYVQKKPIPGKTVATGVISPVYENNYNLYNSDNQKEKIAIARSYGANFFLTCANDNFQIAGIKTIHLEKEFDAFTNQLLQILNNDKG